MSGFRLSLAALLGHWRRRPAQAAALFIGLALATALWSGVQGVNAEARGAYDRAASMLGEAAVATVRRSDGVRFDQSAFVELRRAGVQVSPVLEGRIAVGGRGLRLLGIEPVTAPPGGALEAGLAQDGAAAALLAIPRRALIAPETLAALGLEDGAAPMTREGRALPALRPSESVAPETVVVDIGEAQRLLAAAGRVSRLLVAADEAPAPETVAAVLGEGFEVRRGSGGADISGLTDSFHLNLTAFALLAFVVGLYIAHSAVGLAFEQRVGTLRTLRACGAPARAVAAALLAEAALFAVAAGGAGVALGWLVAAALLPDVAATLRGLYGAPVSGALSLDPGWWLSGVGMALLGAMLAAGGAAWSALRMSPLAPARPEAWRDAHVARVRRRALGGVALLALAAMIARAGDSLVDGFALLAALLIGAALLLPFALDRALARLAPLARGPVAQWAAADARQALPGLSLALTALMLALAANIGVGAMVGSFRTTFEGWLDRRLASEIYVRVDDDAQADAFERLAAAQPGVTAVLPSRDVEVEIDGFPVDLEGLEDHATYRGNWPLIEAAPEVWEPWAAGRGALVSEQLARRLRVGPGDALTVPTPRGGWRLEVVGVHPDYGATRGQVVVERGAHAARFPQADRGAYGLRVAEGETGAVIAALRAEPAMDGAEIVDQQTVKAFSLDVFERTFAVTGALNALTLGVAGVALLTSLATLSGMRLPQLAPLWAMGTTRRRLAALDGARTLGLAVATALLAIPLGVALAWALVAVVNVQAFGWRLPLSHFPADWARLTALAALTAALAATPPALRLARTPPARLLAIFAQDR